MAEALGSHHPEPYPILPSVVLLYVKLRPDKWLAHFSEVWGLMYLHNYYQSLDVFILKEQGDYKILCSSCLLGKPSFTL